MWLGSNLTLDCYDTAGLRIYFSHDLSIIEIKFLKRVFESISSYTKSIMFLAGNLIEFLIASKGLIELQIIFGSDSVWQFAIASPINVNKITLLFYEKFDIPSCSFLDVQTYCCRSF